MNENLIRYISKRQKRAFNWREFHKIIDSINSDDQFKWYSGLIGIKKLPGDLTLHIFFIQIYML